MSKGSGGKGGSRGVGGAGGRAAATASKTGGGAAGGGGTASVGLNPATVADFSATSRVNAAIHQAGAKLAGSSGRIELAALRQALPAMNRQGFDQHMLRLQQEGKVVLFRDDAINMKRSAERDYLRSGGITLAGGNERHFVYLEHSWKGD